MTQAFNVFELLTVWRLHGTPFCHLSTVCHFKNLIEVCVTELVQKIVHGYGRIQKPAICATEFEARASKGCKPQPMNNNQNHEVEKCKKMIVYHK